MTAAPQRFEEVISKSILLLFVAFHCRANVAHTRQSGPYFCLGFQVKVLKTFHIVPSSLAAGATTPPRGERNVFVFDKRATAADGDGPHRLEPYDEKVKRCRPVNFTDSTTQPIHESSLSPWQQRPPSLRRGRRPPLQRR